MLGNGSLCWWGRVALLDLDLEHAHDSYTSSGEDTSNCNPSLYCSSTYSSILRPNFENVSLANKFTADN